MFNFEFGLEGCLPYQDSQGIVWEAHCLIKRSRNCQGNWSFFAKSENCQGILPFSQTPRDGAKFLYHHFSPKCNYLFCEIWLKGQRSTRSVMNVMLAPLAKWAFSDAIEDLNSKRFSLFLLTC